MEQQFSTSQEPFEKEPSMSKGISGYSDALTAIDSMEQKQNLITVTKAPVEPLRMGAPLGIAFSVPNPPIQRLIRKRDEKRIEKGLDTSPNFARSVSLQDNPRVGSSYDRASYAHSIDHCEECKSIDLVIKQREGTIVCQACGLVQQSRIIDESSEWRTFSSETSSSGANPSRVGGKLNPYLSNYGIDTQVKGVNASEIQKWSDRSSLSAKDKQISKGMRQIREMANRLNLQGLIIHYMNESLNLKEPAFNKACEIYKQIEDKGIKGVSVNAKVATVIFVASRIEKQPKGITIITINNSMVYLLSIYKEILQVDNVSHKELSSCYKKVKELLPELKNQVQLDARQIADSAANRLQLPMDVNNAARFVTDQIARLQIATGRQPQTIAGVALFMVSQLSTDKKSCGEIADAVNITEPTIKQAYRDIYEFRNQVIPPWWKHKEPIEALQRP